LELKFKDKFVIAVSFETNSTLLYIGVSLMFMGFAGGAGYLGFSLGDIAYKAIAVMLLFGLYGLVIDFKDSFNKPSEGAIKAYIDSKANGVEL